MEINYWLIWVILGLALLASEIFTGTFYLLFFGLAGLLTAVIVYAFLPPVWLQIFVFGVLSLISFFIVQKKFNRKEKSSFENDLHQTLILSDTLPAGGEGVIQYQGAPWTAVNLESEPLLKGSRAVIFKTEGVKLFLKKA